MSNKDRPIYGLSRLLRIMKLTTFLLLITFITVNASVYSQITKLDLKVQGLTVKEVLNKIEDQSKFFFMYNDRKIDVDRKVDIDLKQANIEFILENIFQGTMTRFLIKDRQIVLFNEGDNTISGNSKSMTDQQKSVSGKVTDSAGGPLPGVSVIIKGTTVGTITDSDGKYTLSNLPSNATLQFSFVGMKTQEISIGAKTVLNVVLEEETVGLEEVVAVGYGTQSKVKLTSSVSTVKPKEFLNIPYTNVGSALAGRVAGVIIESKGGEPGSAPSISIRGGADPLYVIDGVVRSKDDFIALSKEDINNISILKDASATAVYGARGANGIVLVNTKQGGYKEEFHITYKNNFGASSLSQAIDYISSYNYARVANALAQSSGLGPYSVYSQLVMDTIKNNLNPNRYPNTDWYKTLMHKYAIQQDHSLVLTGGSDNTKYYVGLGYLDQGSNYRFDAYNFTRYNYRSSVTSKFDKIGLEVTLNLNGYVSNKKSPTQMPHKEAVHPLDKPYNSDGTISALTDHPLADISPGSGYQKDDTYFNDANLVFTWSVPGIKGLKIKALGDYSITNYNFDGFYTLAAQYDELGNKRANPAPSKYVKYSRTLSYNIEGQVDYFRSFGKHNMNFTLVSTTSAGNNKWFSAGRKDYMSTAVDQLFAGASGTMTNDGNASEWGRTGFVGRAKYDFSNRYMIEFSGRYDGSDNFPKGKRWGFFPSVSLAWNISDESFFAILKEKQIFNSFKIRGSFGTVGNDNVTRFAYVPSYNMNSQVFVSGGQLLNGFSEGALTSDNLSWYTTKSYDIGFDFSTLDSHLSGSCDYFYTRTTGYLTSPQTQYVDPLGKSLPQIKSDAAYRKAGIDGSVSYNNKAGQLSYSIGFNMTYYNSLWEKANEDAVTSQNPYTRTQGVSEDYYGSMYTSLGFYQSFDDILNSPRRIGSTSLAPGDIKYKDENGDGKIDAQDYRRQGHNSSPRFVFGIDLNAEYKGFKFSALLQGTGKRDLYIGSLLQAQELNRYNYNYQADFWTPDNTDAMYPRAAVGTTNSSNNYVNSSFWLINAQFIRLKSVNISYDLKKTVFKKMDWIGSFSVYVSGTNLLTFSPCKKYLDPEAYDSNNFGYPVNTTYSMGINLGF